MKYIQKFESYLKEYDRGDIVKRKSDGKIGVVTMPIGFDAGLTDNPNVHTKLFSYFVSFFGNKGIGEPYHVIDLEPTTPEERELFISTNKYNL